MRSKSNILMLDVLIEVPNNLKATRLMSCTVCNITQTRPCNIQQYFTAVKMFIFRYKFLIFLAHLSRRLIGELIVYEGIRRPSVLRLSTFSNDISSEAVRPILFIFHI